LRKMSDAARAMSHPDAAKEIAELAAEVSGIENSAVSL
jgi:UDP-N-acetylglucosamine:LPS N-acetylglucosamine transferase